MKKTFHQTLDFVLLIPCYNNLQGLILSLKSVEYILSKFAILIIDDGSREPLQIADLLPHISPELPVEIISLGKNQGITKALNTGLQYVQEKYHTLFIARLDCGDICTANRFYKQVSFLMENPEIDLVGSWCLFRDPATGKQYQYRTPTGHNRITRGMHFRNMFIHPTVMWSVKAMQKADVYPEEFPYAEDYGFFYKLLNNGKCAVIPENLVTCEINTKGISINFRKKQLVSRMKVVKYYGKSNVFRIVGVIKLWILMAIPYRMVLGTKQALYGK